MTPADRCGCGHTRQTHATRRHSCSVCVWCDEYRTPPARGTMNRPVGADHSRRTPTGLTAPMPATPPR